MGTLSLDDMLVLTCDPISLPPPSTQIVRFQRGARGEGLRRGCNVRHELLPYRYGHRPQALRPAPAEPVVR